MNSRTLVLRQLKKNVQNYSLYVFALIFSVALYFSFVTLQFDPSMDEAEGTLKGAAAIRAASVLLIGIVTVFLFYANMIFIKRRGKEIGLYQLVGMTKNMVFRNITFENSLLYFSSLGMGIFIGFSSSKLILMILFKVTGVEGISRLQFSSEAFLQTLIVFTGIFLFISFVNYVFIKRQSILSLFRVRSLTEERVKKIRWWEMLIGILGILLILAGYYVSSQLFSSDIGSLNELSLKMVFILACVIVGTYFFFKGSVTFLFNLLRKSKGGYLTVTDVVSLSSIMFKMKSNALLLTVVTTVSALSLGFLSLSYISYYSAEKTAELLVPDDFALYHEDQAEEFIEKLSKEAITFAERRVPVWQVRVDMSSIVEHDMKEVMLEFEDTTLAVVSDESIADIDVKDSEVIFSGFSDMMETLISFKSSGTVTMLGEAGNLSLEFQGFRDEKIVPVYYTGGGLPTVIVDEKVFRSLEPEMKELYIGINITDAKDVAAAHDVFKRLEQPEDDIPSESQLEVLQSQKQNMGFLMFIVGFLGLTFLVTSGCILYFKQMDEGETERGSYTILRKLGFTERDLVKGIRIKQLFSFGIPLMIGLSHSYFAVKSGWFFFGSELWAPLFIVMGVYTVLYSLFGILSVRYYKNVIREAL
ncbi:bacitracin ABC transporter permease [Bacillus coahuilensis p1.1.43]|uniref:Bacitracin ABC transporter permease n=1 Tax=Bacillus coahuilensis p1.1.43 TaxID=1150625 RepID=A0A147K410_9BACI|nr:ABC transporter permease [Bacillus coahuilensis]KUP04038.1 bacitracin ABC transporter permease [Bacillus coahuilensis p1.1.43]